jgi:hypothetical protein
MQQFEGAEHYVEGALRLLQFVEARRPTGRRFGADADARWGSFRGDLETVDRIELMIRDADAEWPGGFGARAVFAMQGVAEDEPFGSQWEGLDPVAAEELWRRVKAEPAPASAAAVLGAIARAWGVALAAPPSVAVAPTDVLVVAGASAIAAVIEAFAAGAAVDWAEQVVIVASSPAARQLAAAGTALLNATRPATIVAATDAVVVVVKRGARLLVPVPGRAQGVPGADRGRRGRLDLGHARGPPVVA